VTAESLRAAVIGCGWIGSLVADDPRAQGIQAHTAAYVATPGTVLAAVCDADAGRAAQAAQRWGLTQSYTEVAALLAAVRPQIVSVCTPDASHAAVLGAVLASPEIRVVVAEKPLAMSLTEARPLVELARRRGVTLAVNYTRRYSAAHADARRRVAAGEIGAVVAVSGLYTKGVVHNGTHWFDLARWLVGDIERVAAWPGATAEPAGDPTCSVRLRFSGGQSGVLLGLDAERYSVFEMDCIGSDGRLRISEGGMRLTWSKAGESPYFSGYRTLLAAPEVPGGFRDAALLLIEDAIMAQRAQLPPRCSGNDALAALAIAEAARAALAEGTERSVEASA
jgi:predicted dehydrogenase